MCEKCFLCGGEAQCSMELVAWKIRGETILSEDHIGRCSECGQEWSLWDIDAVGKAYEAYRKKHGFLTPEEIIHIREKQGLNQKEFADLLGLRESTIERIEGGGLQEESHDMLIRGLLNV